jgi:hypothetical protein
MKLERRDNALLFAITVAESLVYVFAFSAKDAYAA